jgi:hypothetical protein
MAEEIDRWDPRYEVFLHYDVTRLLDSHARGCDRQDWDPVRAAYHPDGLDIHGVFDGLGTDFVEMMSSRPDTVLVMQHLLARTLLLRVDREQRTVLAETPGVAYQQQTHDAPTTPDVYHVSVDPETGVPQAGVSVLGYRYLDYLTERDGNLLIQKRTVIFEFSGAIPLAGADYLDGKLRAVRGPSDFSFQDVSV